MLAEDLLIVMRTVLAAPVAVEDEAIGWHSESDGELGELEQRARERLLTTRRMA